jgi:hypothetical protein
MAILITQSYGQLKTALTAEFGTFPVYFVSQKGSFDTLTLLDEPQPTTTTAAGLPDLSSFGNPVKS